MIEAGSESPGTKISKKKVNFWQNRLFLVGLLIVALILTMGIFAPYIAPNDPLETDILQRFQPPGQDFIMGTDNLGRCIFSRIIYGIRTSLFIPAAVLTVSLFISGILGTLAGLIGGKVDRTISFMINLTLAFPGLVLALGLAGLMGPGPVNLIAALVAGYWANYARIIRGMVISVKENDYITAARASGASKTRIILRHILPNIASPVIVLASMDIGKIILSVAGLSFLGLGVQPPVPEWGSMLNAGRSYFQSAPWLMVFPGLAIMQVVLGFNLLGEGLQEILETRGE